jgi:uncharacterized phage protein (TIGR02218 family)
MSTPVELYRFTIDASVWTWTSGDAAIDYNGETYTPEPIGRNPIEQGQEINRANLTLRVPITNEIGALFLGVAQNAPGSLTVYRMTDAGTATYWKGRVNGAKARGAEVELNCESAFTSLRRTGLRARYTVACRHALYNRGCGLTLGDWGLTTLLDAIDNRVLTISDAALQADGWYTTGLVQLQSGAFRWISDHTGDQVTLARPFDGIVEELAASGYGDSYGNYYGGFGVTIYPGCDRTRATCNDKFDNILNYGGCPWIPSTHPFNGSSIV